ncbi:MAG: membrane protein of unknown function [Promethearchaeota archaeon]|nr:MAG: membrane protein of unknown function [Candidatus Lokiarchaeota archaeon]
MNLRKSKKIKSEPINWILIAISFLVLAGLGLIFITQMEFQSGWFYQDLRETYSMELYAFKTDDIGGNGNEDIISYVDIHRRDDSVKPQYDTPQFGAVLALDGATGTNLWMNTYTGPVKKVFPLPDLDGDSIQDYFISVATVNESWYNFSHDWGYEMKPYIYIDQFTNKIISGKDGEDIVTAEDFPSTGFIDMIALDNLDDVGDLFCLEYYNGSYDDDYNVNITSYYSNGTQISSHNFTGYNQLDNFYGKDFRPSLDFLPINDEDYILLISGDGISLLNLTTLDTQNPENKYSWKDKNLEFENIVKVKDQNADGNEEVLLINRYSDIDHKFNTTLLDGGDFSVKDSFNLSLDEGFDYQCEGLEQLFYLGEENKTYVLINLEGDNDQTQARNLYSFVYELDSFGFGENPLWEYEKRFDDDNGNVHTFALQEDLDGDFLGEIVLIESYRPLLSPQVNRYRIINPNSNKNLAIINTDQWVQDIFTIDDFNGDSKKDMLILSWQSVSALSTQDPVPIFLSSIFPLGIPLFIIFLAMIIIGIVILIRNGKKLSVQREKIVGSLKERKLAVIVNFVVISLMTLTFMMFLLQINIFNQTLITGHYMTNISIAFLTTSIIWYALLPFTAAIYNHFAPRFAYFFINLRNFSFKLSKRYYNEIFVVDMEGREELGLLVKLKRVLLPLLFSIAIGFYTYNTAAPILGYPMGFDVFASEEFFNFIVGFNILCVLPMILTYIFFSFFIAGNYLLDDAGIVYFRQPKKHRQPGDIEPISIWAQSIIKGVAGISAIITFVQFFSSVDFSGFFQGEGVSIIFGFFMTIVFFWGIPFLTAFSYILLAEEIMEFSLEENKKKLYEIMETNGYDTEPRKITNLKPQEKEITKVSD